MLEACKSELRVVSQQFCVVLQPVCEHCTVYSDWSCSVLHFHALSHASERKKHYFSALLQISFIDNDQ